MKAIDEDLPLPLTIVSSMGIRLGDWYMPKTDKTKRIQAPKPMKMCFFLKRNGIERLQKGNYL